MPGLTGFTAGQRRSFRRRRLAALRLAPPLGTPDRPASALAVAKALGALQAQDYGSGAWSLGARTGLTAAEVEDAVRAKEVVRTWPMRGTIHWVPAEDARWMCRLLAAPHLRALDNRYRQLGIGTAEIDLARRLFERHLTTPMSRPRAVAMLAEAGIDPSEQRAYHLVGHHCMTGLLCQGPLEGKQPTFVLIDSWVPRSLELAREEAMATVVERYLLGHGPVLLRDVAGWMTATLGFTREALALLGDRVCSEEVGGDTYLSHVDAPDEPGPAGVRLLPQWDELLLGYKDRELMLAPEDVAKVIPGRNMVFQPTLSIDGEVVGTWTRRVSGQRTVVKVTTFVPLSAGRLRELEREVAAYGRFLGSSATLELTGAQGG